MKALRLLLEMIITLPRRLFSNISVFSIVKDSQVHKTSAIDFGSKLYWSRIGKYSFVAKNTSIYHTEIGNFCSIGSNCVIGPANHPLNWVSTSSVFHKGKNILKRNFATHEFNPNRQTRIGNDVWIATNVIIVNGLRIGDGAVIGAGSVVTKDVEPYTIVVGSPARPIRKRFDEKTINVLLKVEWWNWDENEIESMQTCFNNIELFTSLVSQRR